MKKLILLLLLANSYVASAQTVLWSENFTAEADGAITGTATGGTWSVSTSPPGTFSKQTRIGEPLFQANNTGTEGVFETNVIDISATGMVTISVDFQTALTSTTDYLRAYYRIDGGPEVLFTELLGQLISITTSGSAIVAGNNLQIVIRGSENTPGNIPFTALPIALHFDNLTVTSVPVLYSCNNSNTVFTGNWNVAATWSTVGFTGPCNAAAPPTVAQVAAIGGGVTVNLTADANVGGVDVRSTGSLFYTADNLNVGIEMGLFRVQSGGVVEENSRVAAQIDFTQNVGGASFQVDAGGTVDIDNISLTNNANNLHYLNGGGTLTIGQILIDTDNATLTNNRTAATTLSGNLVFTTNSSGSTFVNNATMTAPSLEFTGDDNFFTNNSIVSFPTSILASNAGADDNTTTNSTGATLNFGNLNADGSAASTNGGNLTILNSGTINQTGTFLRIANNTTALNDINNLAGATWNYAGTGHDTDIRLFANNGTNDFNYSASGAQQIIAPVAGNGYSNINLQTSGAKTAVGNFSVYKNWSRTGTATFAPAGFTVTFSGTGAQTIAAVGGETFAGLTFNNSFVTSPQITLSNPVTVTGVLTMTAGNVNLNGNNFTLSSTAAGALVHGLTSASGWMYGGNIIRNRPGSTTITVGTAHSLFPLGSAGDWRPFFAGQTSNANSAGTITVSHTNATTTSTVVFPESIVRRHNAFWTVSSTGISAGPTFNLRAGGTNFGTIEAGAPGLSDLRMSTATGVVGTHGAATATGSDYRVNRTAVAFASLANNYHVASTDAVNSPLPIELISFTGNVVENTIQLNWKTASEVNNDFFTVERSEAGEIFTSLGSVKGSGTTNQENAYSLIDYNPIYGTAYYRLKQTDFGGTFTYSKIIKVVYEGPTVPVLDVYPNPSTGDQISIKISGLKNVESVPVVLFDQVGKECMRFTLSVDTGSGIAYKIFSLEKTLPQGIYMLKAGPSLLMQKRLVVVSE